MYIYIYIYIQSVYIYIYIYIAREAFDNPLVPRLEYPLSSQSVNFNFVSVDNVCFPYQLITSVVTVTLTLLASRWPLSVAQWSVQRPDGGAWMASLPYRISWISRKNSQRQRNPSITFIASRDLLTTIGKRDFGCKCYGNTPARIVSGPTPFPRQWKRWTCSENVRICSQ